jgi:hypothetical protein
MRPSSRGPISPAAAVASTTVAEGLFRYFISFLNFHFWILDSHWNINGRLPCPLSRDRARRPRRLCSLLVNDELGYFVEFRHLDLFFIFFMVPSCMVILPSCAAMFAEWRSWLFQDTGRRLCIDRSNWFWCVYLLCSPERWFLNLR